MPDATVSTRAPSRPNSRELVTALQSVPLAELAAFCSRRLAGPMPDEVLDHLLDDMTPGRKKKNHCARGHCLEDWAGHVYYWRGRRWCRTCQRLALERRRQREAQMPVVAPAMAGL
jgi:hypothetical protein